MWYSLLLFFYKFTCIITFMAWFQDSSQIKGSGYISYPALSAKIGLFQKKIQTGKLKTYFFERAHGTKLHPWKFLKIVLDPLMNPRNSTFLIDLWNFHILFFQYSWKSYVLSPQVGFF